MQVGPAFRFSHDGRALVFEAIISALALAMLVGVGLADQNWFDQHFLPNYFISREATIWSERAARFAVGMFSVVLLLVIRPAVGRLVAGSTFRELVGLTVPSLVALLLGLFTGEFALEALHWRATGDAPLAEETAFKADPRLGWTFTPERHNHETVGGRTVDYDFDASGFRVGSLSSPVDARLPAVLFSGESIMAGYGLGWDESIPARVGMRLKVQTANLAVFGYSTDQAYLRLAGAISRFQHPLAIVLLFTPELLFRNFDADRPHVGQDGAWIAPRQGSRLAELLHLYVPYRSKEEIDNVIGATRATLRATDELARSRHAKALIVAPHFGPSDSVDRLLRREILDGSGVSYVWVELDPRWRIPDDDHPDARGADAIAQAIAARLRTL